MIAERCGFFWKHRYHARCKACANKGERSPHFGKHHSEETRKKMSDAHKGESHPHFGKHHSEEARKKMSDAHKGLYPSEETRKKLSDAQKGENNHNWKNGASFEPYCSKWNEPFREYIRDKFDRICFLCHKTEEENGKKLSVHHVNGNKNCGCDDDETCQFVPLCVSCHGKVHSKKIDWEAKIKAKMRNKLNGWCV